MQQTLELDLPQLAGMPKVDETPQVRFSDSAFQDNKITSIHRWVPWIAGFSASFVRDTFAHYLPAQGRYRVLEPFAGVGTTLVEGLLAGHEVVGFEINPFAYLASNVKCHAYNLSAERIKQAVETFTLVTVPHTAAIDNAIISGADPFFATTSPVSTPPENFKSRVPFYSPIVELKVLHCFDGIRAIEDRVVRDLFWLAFGSIMVSISNYSYEPSLGSRVAAGRAQIDDVDVAGKLLLKVRGMRDDILNYRQALSIFTSPPSAVVYNESSLNIKNRLSPKSVDIIVTSPPYLNNYHYIRNTRPHLYWLDFVASSAELKSIEHSSFGKFWQTVRDAAPMSLKFHHEGLENLIKIVSECNPGKGVYGGQGWANYAVQYFNDCYDTCAQLRYVLKPGAHAIFVLGNSIVQGIEIPVDRIFGEIAEMQGLELVDIHMLRTKRVGNSVVKSAARHGTAKGAVLYETAVVVKQVND